MKSTEADKFQNAIGDNTVKVHRINAWSLILTGLFLLIVAIVALMLSGTTTAEHTADVTISDHNDGDRVIEWNSTSVAIDINITCKGPDEISFVTFNIPDNIVVTGWTTTNGNSTLWNDAPDVDGNGGYTTGGSTNEAAPTLRLMATYANNITSGNYELFTLYLRTDEPSTLRGAFAFDVQTTDNRSDVYDSSGYLAVIGMSNYLDICIDLTDHSNNPVDITSALLLLPNSSASPTKTMSTSFEDFPDKLNSSDYATHSSIIQDGLAIWLDGVDYNSNLTDNATYQINTSDPYDDYYVSIETVGGEYFKMMIDDFISGDNSHTAVFDGTIGAYNTLAFSVRSEYYSTLSDAYHNAYVKLVGLDGPGSISGMAYYVNNTSVNSSFVCSEAAAGTYITGYPGIDFAGSAWSTLSDNDTIRIELDVNGDGGIVFCYVHIDSTPPTVDDFYIDDYDGPFSQLVHPYIWYNESSNTLWYQNAMVEASNGNLTETIIINLTASDPHLWTVSGSHAFGEIPEVDEVVKGNYRWFNVTYHIDHVGETADNNRIVITIKDLAGNTALLTINCSLDNTPPEDLQIQQIDFTSPYIYFDGNTLFYRNNVPNMNEDFHVVIAPTLKDGAGGCGIYGVGGYGFYKNVQDTDGSDGWELVYNIQMNYESDDIIITAVDHVFNYITVVLHLQLDNDPPTLPANCVSVEEDASSIYFDPNEGEFGTLYYSNDQPTNAAFTIKVAANDGVDGSGIDTVESTEAFGEFATGTLSDGFYNLHFVISQNESVPGDMIYIMLTDHLGNVATINIPALVDNSPPTSITLELFVDDPNVYFSVPDGTLYYSNDQPMSAMVYINFTGEDDISGLYTASMPVMFNKSYSNLNTYISYFDNGKASLAYSIEMGETGADDINVTIMDRVGNAYYYIINLCLDNDAPTTTDNAPSSWINSDTIIYLNETDNGSGVRYTYYSTDGSSPTTPYYDITGIHISNEGITYLQYYSVDYVNNVQIVVGSEVKIDKTKPTINVTWEPRDINTQTKGAVTIFVQGMDMGGSGLLDAKINWSLTDPDGNDNYTGWEHMEAGSSGQWYYNIDLNWSLLKDYKLVWYISMEDDAGNNIVQKFTELIDYIPPQDHAPVVEIISPVGGDIWTDNRYIRWFAEDTDDDALVFDIYLSWDKGKTFEKIAEGIPGSNRTYLWNTNTVTSSNSSVYVIKVVAREVSNERLEASSESNPFQIFHPKQNDDHPPEITIIHPTEQNSIIYGPEYLIWSATDPDGDNLTVSVYLIRMLDNGTIIRTSLVNTLPMNVHFWKFDPSGIVAGSDYRLEFVVQQSNGSIPWKVTVTTKEFTIYHPSRPDNFPPTVNIYSPGGGETYYAGEDSIPIKWTASDENPGDEKNLRFSLYYSTDGGLTFTQIANDIDGNSYDWKLKNSMESGQYIIKIVCTDGHTLYSSSSYILPSAINIAPNRGPDRDNDGMPNTWEVKYGFNPDNPADAKEDADLDGLNNLQEFQLGTNPLSSDTDNDGMPDAWEHMFNFNPADATDASQDFDGDGYTNLQEYVNQTDPKDANSHPKEVNTITMEKNTGGWITITMLLLVVTLLFMAVLYVTKPDPWDEDELEKEINEWVEKIRKEHPKTMIAPQRKRVHTKKVKGIRKKRKGEAKSKPRKTESKKDEMVDVYISEDAMEKMARHCFEWADRRKEVMGFMMGDRYTYNGVEYTVVKDVITTDLDSSEISVKFNKDGWEELFKAKDKLPKDYIIVGWYHSHPGHTVFMSGTDVRTQETMFNKPFHTAVVIDPINIQMKAFGVKSGVAYDKSFAIFKNGVFGM